MATVGNTNVEVRSGVLNAGELKNVTQRVYSLVKNGYSLMAVMYFLSQRGYTVSETTENGRLILNVA